MSLALSGRQRMARKEREKEREKRKKEGGGGIEIEGRPQERRPLLVYVSESSGCLNGDTFTRAASYGGKADLSAPTIPLPFSPPLPLGSRFSVSPRRCHSALRTLPLPFLRHLSSSGPRCICYPPLARSRSAGLPTRLQRGSCLTRGYFTFPCSPAPRSRRRVAPGYARSVSNRGLRRERGEEWRDGGYPS